MIVLLSGPCTLLQSGDLATWVGSVGTLFAFAVALVIFGINMLDRQRAQARLVTGYILDEIWEHKSGDKADFRRTDNLPYKIPEEVLGDSMSPDADGNFVLAQNATAFSWVLRNDSDEMLGRARLVLLDEHGSEARELFDRDYVLPHSKHGQTLVSPSAEVRLPLRLAVYFQDAVGRTWERRPGLALRRVPRALSRVVLPVPTNRMYERPTKRSLRRRPRRAAR